MGRVLVHLEHLDMCGGPWSMGEPRIWEGLGALERYGGLGTWEGLEVWGGPWCMGGSRSMGRSWCIGRLRSMGRELEHGRV